MRTVVNRKGWSVQQSPPECKDCQSLTEKILVTTWNLKFIEWTQFHSLCAVPQFPCYKGTGGVQAGPFIFGTGRILHITFLVHRGFQLKFIVQKRLRIVKNWSLLGRKCSGKVLTYTLKLMLRIVHWNSRVNLTPNESPVSVRIIVVAV